MLQVLGIFAHASKTAASLSTDKMISESSVHPRLHDGNPDYENTASHVPLFSVSSYEAVADTILMLQDVHNFESSQETPYNRKDCDYDTECQPTEQCLLSEWTENPDNPQKTRLSGPYSFAPRAPNNGQIQKENELL